MSVPPDVDEPFEWRPAAWGALLACRALGDVAHGWSARPLRLRGTAGDEQQEWEAVAAAAGVGAGHLVRLRQVHGTGIHLAPAPPCGTPEADIAFSDDPGTAVAVQVADCVPLLLADRSGAFVAAAHAGWRGTAAEVAGIAVRGLSDHYGISAASLTAAIGPSIGPCCYEVGGELVAAFESRGWTRAQVERWFSQRDGRLHLDLWRASRDQLERAGVPTDRIFVSRLCTACHAGWFHSYRREGAGTGRLAGFIRPVRRQVRRRGAPRLRPS